MQKGDQRRLPLVPFFGTSPGEAGAMYVLYFAVGVGEQLVKAEAVSDADS
jgi:hypothetical protein